MTKLGVLVHHTNPQNLAWVRRSSAIVKQMNGYDALEAAPDSAIRIFRLSVANEMDTSNPVGTIDAMIAALNGYNHPNLYVQPWCGAHPTLDQMVVAVQHAQTRGYKITSSSWYTGDYTQADWDVATNSGVDLYAPQCYWGTQGFTIYHALRFTLFWRPGQKDVVILECGRDKVEGGTGGYFVLQPPWTNQQVADDLNSYDATLQQYPYVVGATPFECGPTQDWITQGFDLDAPSPLIGVQVITQDELGRIAADIYKRANVTYDPTHAFDKYFLAQFKAGAYIGVPTEPVHDSEDGKLALQAFAGQYLWAYKSDYVVHTGPLPLA